MQHTEIFEKITKKTNTNFTYSKHLQTIVAWLDSKEALADDMLHERGLAALAQMMRTRDSANNPHDDAWIFFILETATQEAHFYSDIKKITLIDYFLSRLDTTITLADLGDSKCIFIYKMKQAMIERRQQLAVSCGLINSLESVSALQEREKTRKKDLEGLMDAANDILRNPGQHKFLKQIEMLECIYWRLLDFGKQAKTDQTLLPAQYPTIVAEVAYRLAKLYKIAGDFKQAGVYFDYMSTVEPHSTAHAQYVYCQMKHNLSKVPKKQMQKRKELLSALSCFLTAQIVEAETKVYLKVVDVKKDVVQKKESADAELKINQEAASLFVLLCVEHYVDPDNVYRITDYADTIKDLQRLKIAPGYKNQHAYLLCMLKASMAKREQESSAYFTSEKFKTYKAELSGLAGKGYFQAQQTYAEWLLEECSYLPSKKAKLDNLNMAMRYVDKILEKGYPDRPRLKYKLSNRIFVTERMQDNQPVVLPVAQIPVSQIPVSQIHVSPQLKKNTNNQDLTNQNKPSKPKKKKCEKQFTCYRQKANNVSANMKSILNAFPKTNLAFHVGGSVRNLVNSKKHEDEYDVVTNASEDVLRQHFDYVKKSKNFSKNGKEIGELFFVRLGNLEIEVLRSYALLPQEGKSVDELLRDHALLCDFGANTVLIDRIPNLISPLGEWCIDDIKKHQLTIVHNDHQRFFTEDPMRFCRLVKFELRGHRCQQLNAKGVKALVETCLKPEHYHPAQKEINMIKLLHTSSGLLALQKMQTYGMLHAFFPECHFQDPFIFEWVRCEFDKQYQIMQDSSFSSSLASHLIYLPFFIAAYYNAKQENANLALASYLLTWLSMQQVSNKVAGLYYLVNVLEGRYQELSQYMQKAQVDKTAATIELKTEVAQTHTQVTQHMMREHRSLLNSSSAMFSDPSTVMPTAMQPGQSASNQNSPRLGSG